MQVIQSDKNTDKLEKHKQHFDDIKSYLTVGYSILCVSVTESTMFNHICQL